MILNRGRRELVLAIRGTSSVHDVLTDLTFQTTELQLPDGLLRRARPCLCARACVWPSLHLRLCLCLPGYVCRCLRVWKNICRMILVGGP